MFCFVFKIICRCNVYYTMTEWTDLVQKTFKAGKLENADYKLKDAMKEAAKIYNGGKKKNGGQKTNCGGKKTNGGNQKMVDGGNNNNEDGTEGDPDATIVNGTGNEENHDLPQSNGGKSKRKSRKHKKSKTHKKKTAKRH